MAKKKEPENKQEPVPATSDFILYTSSPGDVRVEVFFHNESVWMTQKRMGELFEKDRSVITKHLRNIFKTNELDE